MNESIVDRDRRICTNCDLREKTHVTVCPRCGHEFQTEFSIQKRALLGIVVGLGIVLLGIYVFAVTNPMTRGSSMPQRMIGLLDVVFVFAWGIPMLIGSIWLYITGRDIERPMKIVGIGTATVAFIAAMTAQFLMN